VFRVALYEFTSLCPPFPSVLHTVAYQLNSVDSKTTTQMKLNYKSICEEDMHLSQWNLECLIPVVFLLSVSFLSLFLLFPGLLEAVGSTLS
jgi:hypothetical protein